jgi:hypothetical protein
MRKRALSLVLGLVSTCTFTASAAPLLELSGKVALADGAVPTGTKVKLGVDLNRDNEIQEFESLTGSANADGSYQVGYDLDPSDVDLEFIAYATEVVAKYQTDGFESLIEDGPLPLVITIEREGYSTLTRTFSSLLDNPRLDALLTPLEKIGCTDGVCRTGSGGIEISGFPGGTGIERAFAKEYDPTQDTSRFPGNFSDSGGNLLISSGFLEVDLRDSSGAHVHELPEPVKVRFQPNKVSWKTLRDLDANSSRIEVPMYSFDEVKGQWVAEPDGVLEDEDGKAIAESELAAIKSGGYTGKVFIAFSTKHFSTFNCDEPVESRACVKGRLVKDGQPLAGISVSANGVNYTGTAGTLTTGLDGRFASDLMKSETANEDVDGNGKRGETFTAQLAATSELGIFVGAAFDAPTVQGSIGGDIATCKPASCDCLDLGDIEVTFEMPRACEVTVHATYSGKSIGAKANLAAGDALEGATLRGELMGDISMPVSATAEACGAGSCYSSVASANGTATFIVPVIGDAPEIKLHAEHYFTDSGAAHAYVGDVTIAGCARGQSKVEVTAEVEADHAALGDMGSFIDSLGAGSANDDGDGWPVPEDGAGCGCSYVGAMGQAGALGVSVVSALGLALRRIRRRSGV